MNILFVTTESQDAEPIRDEMARSVPDVHIEVSPDIDEAIGMATTPGRFDAVLLDSALCEGAPSALIRALRSQSLPVAVVALASPSDLHSVAKIMGAGADDYVLKRAGFAAALPVTLRRACAKYDGEEQAQTPGRLLYATTVSRISRARSNAVALRPVPSRRDATAATCFLLRDVPEDAESEANSVPEPVKPAAVQATGRTGRDAFLHALKISNATRLRLKSDLSALRLQREQERAEFEERSRSSVEELRAALEQRSKAQQDLQAVQDLLGQRVEELRAERQQRERWHMLLKERLAAVEESRAALEQSVLVESTRHEQLELQCTQYASQIDAATRALQQERVRAAEEAARTRALIESAETRVRSLAGEHRTEREEWVAARAELEARISALQEARTALESEHRLTLERREAESALWDSVRNELEQQISLLQDELVTARGQNTGLLETREEYRMKWESTEAELLQLRSGVAQVHALAREAADLYQVFLEKLRNYDSASATGAGITQHVD